MNSRRPVPAIPRRHEPCAVLGKDNPVVLVRGDGGPVSRKVRDHIVLEFEDTLAIRIARTGHETPVRIPELPPIAKRTDHQQGG